MVPFSSSIEHDLHWIQPRFGAKLFELRTAEGLVGTLRWERALGTLATADLDGRRWTFKRVGFWNPRVTVRDAGSPEDAAVFQPTLWGGGTLVFPSGRRFEWRPINFWATRWAFFDERSVSLFTLREGADDAQLADLFKTQAIVEVAPAGRECGELPPLVLLGWYLFVSRQDEVAAVAATTSVS